MTISAYSKLLEGGSPGGHPSRRAPVAAVYGMGGDADYTVTSGIIAHHVARWFDIGGSESVFYSLFHCLPYRLFRYFRSPREFD